jgi:hypothetical protein
MTAVLRLAAVLGLMMVACSGSSNDTTSSSSRTSSPPSVAVLSQAADLRTHLDLLLGEHVMIVAKESAAAANHSDEYTGYTALLTTNLTDLSSLMRDAFGNTAGDEFSQAWSKQNANLVDYAIGVVTHSDAKANAAMSTLSSGFVPQFAALINDMSGLSTGSIAQLATLQLQEDKAFIDDVSAQKYQQLYADLMKAYAQSARFGDALAERIAQKFPDKFPGDPTLPAADRRASLNLLLQEHAFLATMATDAVAAGRDAERTAAAAAVGVDAVVLSRALSDLFGGSSSAQFDKVWADRDAALLIYASKGDADSKKALSATIQLFSAAAHVAAASVTDEMNALIKVIDDQRAKTSKTIAGDDRTAATSMEPIADAIVASSQS